MRPLLHLLTDEQRDQLCDAAIAAVERKQDEIFQRGMRSQVYWSQDGRECLCYGNARDAHGTLYRVHVEASMRSPGQVTVTVESWPVLREEFWEAQAADRTNAVVVDGVHYRIVPDGASGPREMAGHGGRLFRIRYLADGRVVESRNLWCQGDIPAAYRERIPENAEFVRDGA